MLARMTSAQCLKHSTCHGATSKKKAPESAPVFLTGAAYARVGSKAPAWPSTADFGLPPTSENVPALRKLSRRATAQSWLNAGGNLSRPNSIDQCAARASIRSEQPPKCLLH